MADSAAASAASGGTMTDLREAGKLKGKFRAKLENGVMGRVVPRPRGSRLAMGSHLTMRATGTPG
ncbi:hypothetical protein ASD80_02150 [Devosia sp. Root635]|nr:hypothetical protein ASD80_02150 [Devosia sp. Root635]